MTLTEVFFLVAAASAFGLVAFTVISIAKPSARSEMGVRLHGDLGDLEREMKEALNKITDEELYSLCVKHEMSKDKKSEDNQ